MTTKENADFATHRLLGERGNIYVMAKPTRGKKLSAFQEE